MKKILFRFLTICCLLVLTACGGGGSNYDDSVTPKLGDTVITEDFEITLISYTLGKAISATEDYQDLIYLDVKIKNVSDKASRYNTNKFTIYGPNSTKIRPISGSKYSTSVSNLESIRPNGVASAQMIFPFLGYGTYYIEFAGINGIVTAEIDIKE